MTTLNSPQAICVEGVTKDYYLGVRRKKICALAEVTLDTPKGEVFAFLGLNGAGKTTTIKLLLDHARPTTGRVALFGIDARDPKSRLCVGYMPDLPHFYRFLTPIELLDYFGRVFGLPVTVRKERSQRLLDLVGLSDRGREPLKGFSRGMLQRVGLAQALINDPELLILDEPLGGLDPVGRFEFHNIIIDLKRAGKTIFFSSHILEDAERVADRVGIIHKGKLLACGPIDELIGKRSGWEAELEVIDPAAWNSQSGSFELSPADGGRFICRLPDEAALGRVTALAGNRTVMLHSLQPVRVTLEQAFLSELQRWAA